MEKCRETSEGYKGRGWVILIAAALAVWLGVEIKSIFDGQINAMNLWYIIFLTGILIWQYAFRYTCILTDKSFIVVSEVLGIRRTLEVRFGQAEGFSNNFVKKLFRRTGIKRYIYKYSNFDRRPLNIFLFKSDGEIHAVLFRASGEFINEMKKVIPSKYFDMSGKKLDKDEE